MSLILTKEIQSGIVIKRTSVSIKVWNITSKYMPAVNLMAHSIFSDISEVNDHLCISPARAVTVDSLRRHGITLVVNATRDIPNLHIKGVEYFKIPVDDTLTANLLEHFGTVADKIHEECKKGGKTLVHCIAGASRSASLCIAYLMKYQKMSLREAFCFLKSCRQVVRPNNNFFNQLIEYEQKLYNKTTVKMITIPGLGEDCLVPDIYKEECKGYLWFSFR